MAETVTHRSAVHHTTTNEREVSGWVGWIGFASALLWLAGFFHLIAGFVALFKNDVYVSTARNVWILDYSAWGWIHIIGGLLAIVAASSLFRGGMFGRAVAVIFAMLSAIANMAFIPIYPIWSLIIITIDFLVLWAVIVHGREMTGHDY